MIASNAHLSSATLTITLNTDVLVWQELLQLPNGWQVNAESQLEATYIYNEIFGEEQVYMQYGVQIHEGDVVVDVGANVGAPCKLDTFRTGVSHWRSLTSNEHDFK